MTIAGSSSMRLSVSLQPLAQALSETLREIAGEEVSFILVIQVDKVLQYVSSVERSKSKEILEELMTRWAANRADIPAHMNPDLKASDVEKSP